MKANIFSTLALVILLAGCASVPKRDIYTYHNDVGGQGVDIIVDNELDSGEKPSELIWLNASRVREGAWDGKYYLEVRYQALAKTGWLDIAPGENLTLTVDGQTMKFLGSGSLNDRREAQGTFIEHAIYKVTPDDLRKIAKAKEVKVDITGSKRTIHREFKPENIEKFRTFVLMYMGF